MKLRDLLAHLHAHGCRLLREGGRHSIYQNPANGNTTAVPRHAEVNNFTARQICKDLVIPPPPQKWRGSITEKSGPTSGEKLLIEISTPGTRAVDLPASEPRAVARMSP